MTQFILQTPDLLKNQVWEFVFFLIGAIYTAVFIGRFADTYRPNSLNAHKLNLKIPENLKDIQAED
ncbi:hypothetical protein [Sediminibacterium soli]|uniref:hypothetical protein n=1 Tax=Sediminibacterium soli TaxID=2698829 RepID=UPI0013796CFE|nr:hypothetical protein [Sediminibacterium soli]NCI47913.1 hypothetical protein [Sediminibacterium soli]